MQRKRVSLVTGTEVTLLSLREQLTDMLGESVTIEGYALDATATDHLMIEADLIVLSTQQIVEQARAYLHPACETIIARRVTNYQHIDQLLMLPQGTKVLFVNDHSDTITESIDSLTKLGVDHLIYIPYNPNHDLLQAAPDVEIAITPGEVELVPAHIEKTINIGPRLLDIMTIAEICGKLNLSHTDHVHITERYMKKIVQLGKEMAEATKQALTSNRYLGKVLDGVNEGILAVDGQGMITIFNENLEHLSRMSSERAIRKPLRQVITIPELIAFLEAKTGEETQLFHVQGNDMVVTRFPQNEGFIATFQHVKDLAKKERKWRRELASRGYVAKYTFADIIGSSVKIEVAKSIATKLAKTGLTVLIEGESGTGKELFASAIHNESERRREPFLAVNFSALSEDLVESELFGYEEGAFTGAKKGGKSGLFEQAANGTIFLDEIGDISLKIQARLLRVLQEKEVMRVGGSKIIPVDVRVVAATNKNLLKMIDEGQFREDLYHRLKVLYVKLPPLRERPEDIPLLAQHFLTQSSLKPLTIADSVMEKLCRYPWFGNVRECKNTIDYMLAVCEGEQISDDDIPEESFFQRAKPTLATPLDKGQTVGKREMSQIPEWKELESLGEPKIYLELLRVIDVLKQAGMSTGRKTLSFRLQERGITLSEQQIRRKMDILEAHGFLTKAQGRAGSYASAKGYRILDMLHTFSTSL